MLRKLLYNFVPISISRKNAGPIIGAELKCFKKKVSDGNGELGWTSCGPNDKQKIQESAMDRYIRYKHFITDASDHQIDISNDETVLAAEKYIDSNSSNSSELTGYDPDGMPKWIKISFKRLERKKTYI